jgi:hypothetical protein
MGLSRIALAPLYWLAGWADDNPVSAVGAVVAVGALAVLFATVSLGSGTEAGTVALDSETAGVLAETARERPAYLAVALVGVVVALLYDG